MRRLLAAALVATLLISASALRADNRFYRILASKPNATFEDAVHAFYNLALETEVAKTSFDEQSQALIGMKIIRSKWTQKPKLRLTRGRAAYMICQTCGIRGGLTMTLLGPSERYAFRECRYLGAWSGGNQQDYMTGGELLGVLKWAADYIEEHPGRKVRPGGAAVPALKTAPREDVAAELDAAERSKKTKP
ncbi:MAG: hypothetical protein AMS16_02430 [Planctomycetes bacterium DG_58]|nr:MAG: hypothetical protein AMS16_02430 [Planctomycetes bacterium DG_58]KPL04751.1 MAG: hypothetical protein AMK75_00625 [Planctomycetes bacterium SM23_65]